MILFIIVMLFLYMFFGTIGIGLGAIIAVIAFPIMLAKSHNKKDNQLPKEPENHHPARKF